MVFQRVGIPRGRRHYLLASSSRPETLWPGHGLYLPGLRKEVFPTRPGDAYGGYRWEKSKQKAVVGTNQIHVR